MSSDAETAPTVTTETTETKVTEKVTEEVTVTSTPVASEPVMTEPVTTEPVMSEAATSEPAEKVDVRRSRIAFTHKFADDLPPLKPLKFTHVSPAVAGPIHRSKNYTEALVCDQKIAMEQLRHIRRNLEREDRELRRLQLEFEQFRTPRKWSSTYY